MKKESGSLEDEKDSHNEMNMWGFFYNIVKGVARKIFSHGVFVIIIIILTVFVCLLAKNTNNIDSNSNKEVKTYESDSKIN